MKRYCCFILFSLLIWNHLKADETPCSTDSCARFEVLGEFLRDFGDVGNDAGSISSSFWLKSTGTVPMIILSNSTSCPCTQVYYDKDIILPGDSVEVKLTYEPKSHLGYFLQSVLLKTNTVPEDYIRFYLKGTVVEAITRD